MPCRFIQFVPIVAMGVLSFLFGSCSKPRVDQHPENQSELQALQLVIGPSPWAFRDQSVAAGGVSYRFRETAPGDGKLAGLTSLEDSAGTTLLVFDFYCYMRILDDGGVLLWRKSGEKAEQRIIFDHFSLSSLDRVSEPHTTATEVRERKIGVSPLRQSEHWEFPPQLEAGVHAISIPHDWSRFKETLVLTDHADTIDKPAQAIFAFDWAQRQAEVFPQDWFNNGDYDFGYQWITRVARRSDGSIVGDGIRLGSFELDRTNRQVKKWFNTNPFYMIP